MGIVCKDVKKYFKEVKAVDGVSFEIPSGSFFAIIGANGAGKSTLFDMMLQRIKPTSGSITIDGLNVEQVPLSFFTKIGTVYQSSLLDKSISVWNNLLTRAWVFYDKKVAVGIVHDLLDEFNIQSLRDKKYRELSGGERRKVDIICSLLHQPEILILDEPTTGIDVSSRQEIWQLLSYIQSSRKLTIILATHYLEEAELADQMIVLKKGQIVACGSPVSLKETFATDKLFLYTKNIGKVEQYFKSKQIDAAFFSTYVEVNLKKTKDSIQILTDIQDDIDSFEVKFGKLDEVFMNLMGEAK